MNRRKFTGEFKSEAVKLAERGDVPIAHVARKLEDATCRLAQDVGVIQGCLRASRLFDDTG